MGGQAKADRQSGANGMNALNGTSVSDLILFGVVALIGINHVLMRIPGFIHRWWAFLPVLEVST